MKELIKALIISTGLVIGILSLYGTILVGSIMFVQLLAYMTGKI